MSRPNISKILEDCRGADLTATYAFKISDEMKQAFIDYCDANQLSTGKVMRELIRQFLEASNEPN